MLLIQKGDILQPGDTVHVRANSVVSKVIAWGTRGRREHPTLSTHQAIAQSPHDIVHALRSEGVCEMGWNNYRRHLEKEGGEWCIVRPKYITPAQQADIVLCLDEMIGWRYSVSSIFLQGIDGLLAKVFQRKEGTGMDVLVMRNLQRIWKRGVICSETGNRPYIKAGLMSVKMRFASPDCTWDWQKENRVAWPVIAHSDEWWKPEVK